MKKVLIVFGTRPEAIKMAPIVKMLGQIEDELTTRVCITGQHKEMLEQVLHVFEIVPDYNLSVMHEGQDLYDVTSRILLGMRNVLKEFQPDMVLVHGDTTTSVSAALAAFYQQIPVGHVEAGLRTYNKYSPWPEEINRQITTRIASCHYAPTILSMKNLLNEGVSRKDIYVTGNTVIDALHLANDRILNDPEVGDLAIDTFEHEGISRNVINQWGTTRRMVLITGHRRENFGDGLNHICLAIKNLGLRFPDVDFIYPVHLNPNVLGPVYEILGKHEDLPSDAKSRNIYLIKPLDYLPFVYLMSKSYFILTDSGGIQEEAPGLGKPVLVMRDTTERPEAVEAGTVRIIGTSEDKIFSESIELLNNEKHYKNMSEANNPYGDGKAALRIIRQIRLFLLGEQVREKISS